MKNTLEKLINDSNSREIKLKGEINLIVENSNVISIGKGIVRKIITINRPDIVIDGANSTIKIEIDDNVDIDTDIALFYVSGLAKNICLKNMKIYIFVKNPKDITKTFYAIYNGTLGTKLENCTIELMSQNQMNLIGIYNCADISTHMETCADNLVVSNCNIKVRCCTESFTKECNVYGIYNHLGNSISVQNNFIYARNRGVGESQRAFGVYTSGRFGRFIGNNIKACSSHPEGKIREQGSSFGFYNEGYFSIITSNNIIGEWAGMSIGIENRKGYAKISSNKILATHAIRGIGIKNYAEKCIIDGNIIISTSRNPRLIESYGTDCIITNNYIDAVLETDICVTGCGIYLRGNVKGTIIKDNIIKNLKDCGILAERNAGIIKDNIITSNSMKFIDYVETSNLEMMNRLSEKNIRSIID